MQGKRFRVLANSMGTLTVVPAGDPIRARNAEQRGFRIELARVNRPPTEETIRSAYGALLRVYAL